MRYGVILPGGSAVEQLDQAILAEQSGWDGVFVWEAAYGVEAWTLLAAIAARTARIKVGTLLTPLPWRRPWKVASQVATVDQLSGGRTILTVGLGAFEGGLPLTGEVTDLKDRAECLDEGIDLIRALWAGEPRFRSRHYHYDSEGRTELAEVVRPVQEHIPIWVVGAWPRPKSMRRALRCDGVVPQYQEIDREPSPEDARALCRWLAEQGSTIEVIADGETPAEGGPGAVSRVMAWAEAGCTWWLETRWEMPHNSEARLRDVRERIVAGPPRVAGITPSDLSA